MRNKILMYLNLMRMEFINNLAYRSSFFTGIFNYAIQIGAYFFLWEAIYSGQNNLGGFSREEMLTYVIVSWVARSFYFSNLDRTIAMEIQKGNIALELIRPYNYQFIKLARAMGEAIFRMLFFTLPSGLFIYLLRPFQVPPSLNNFFLFGLALLGSFILNAQMSLIAGFFAFFTQSTSGIYRAKRVVMDLLSGLLLPISFYPPWAEKIIKLLPFQSISYQPNLIYLGKIKGAAALNSIGIQFLWIVAFYIAGILVWNYSIKKVVIQGG